MPRDVTMPQLGMAQDAGKIVSWLKAPGDAVSRGDALFEVETDKATMEVEAQSDGYLTNVSAAEGEDVPVGQVIARISDSPEDSGAGESAEAPAAEPASDDAGGETDGDALPEGKSVTMPQLGMAQDSGVLVSWLKSPGDAVAADDLLFEVETDKSTMEVEAGHAGYLAATLAEAGEDVPVGSAVAIISAEEPEAPVARSVKAAPKAPKTASAPEKPQDKSDKNAGSGQPESAEKSTKRTSGHPAPAKGGRVLASPKARRLALEEGLDLNRLAEAGHPQPFHVSDLDTLRAMPAATPGAGPATAKGLRLTAEIAADGSADFAVWAAEAHGLKDADALLAGLAAASLPEAAAATVAVDRFGTTRTYAVPAGRALSQIEATEDAATLILRDLRGTPVRTVDIGAETAPVLTLVSSGTGLAITLECSPAQLEPQAAIALLTHFAGRMEQPLRHLL